MMNVTKMILLQGCANKFMSWTGDNVAILAGVALALAFVQVSIIV